MHLFSIGQTESRLYVATFVTAVANYLFLSIIITYERFLRISALFFCKDSYFINSTKDFCGFPHFSSIETIEMRFERRRAFNTIIFLTQLVCLRRRDDLQKV